MRASPTRRAGEESAYSFRYAWFCFQCSVFLGFALLMLLAFRPDVNRSAAPSLVMMPYVGLPVGTGMAVLSTLGFTINGVLARAFDEDAGRRLVEHDAALPAPESGRSSRWPWVTIGGLWVLGFCIAAFSP